MKYTLPLFFALSCTPSPVVPETPYKRELAASLLLLKEAYDYNGIDQSFPSCGAVALAPNRLATAAHCLRGPSIDEGPSPDLVVGDPARLVDRRLFEGYTDVHFNAVVSSINPYRDYAELTTAYTLVPVPTEPPSDGPAVLIRGFEIEETEVHGFKVRVPVYGGDSGSGVFQGGALVGLITTEGGGFVPVAP